MTNDMISIKEWLTKSNYIIEEKENIFLAEGEEFYVEIENFEEIYYVTIGYSDRICSISRRWIDEETSVEENFFNWFVDNYDNLIEELDNNYLLHSGAHWSLGRDY